MDKVQVKAMLVKRADFAKLHGVKVQVARRSGTAVITYKGTVRVLEGDEGFLFVTKGEALWIAAEDVTIEEVFLTLALEYVEVTADVPS